MINKAPIFLNCLTTGGSNILWNLIVSHPGVCSPTTETHSGFANGFNHGMNKAPRPWHWISFSWSGFALLALTGQPRFFDVRNTRPRRPVSRLAEWIIDRALYLGKMKGLDDEGLKFKSPDILYTAAEMRAARLCAKGNNGLIFLNDVFRRMYPGARFMGLARHPLSVYESWKRRGAVRTPAEFAPLYNAIVGHMADERDGRSDYRLFLFERMVTDPMALAREVYGFLGLDYETQRVFRMQAKKHYQADGTYGTSLEERKYYWFSGEEFAAQLDSDINRRHAEALPAEEARAVLALTEVMRGRLGYGEDPSTPNIRQNP